MNERRYVLLCVSSNSSVRWESIGLKANTLKSNNLSRQGRGATVAAPMTGPHQHVVVISGNGHPPATRWAERTRSGLNFPGWTWQFEAPSWPAGADRVRPDAPHRPRMPGAAPARPLTSDDRPRDSLVDEAADDPRRDPHGGLERERRMDAGALRQAERNRAVDCGRSDDADPGRRPERPDRAHPGTAGPILRAGSARPGHCRGHRVCRQPPGLRQQRLPRSLLSVPLTSIPPTVTAASRPARPVGSRERTAPSLSER